MTPHEVTQVDAILTEDGKTVLLYGHTRKADRTYLALVDLPKPIEEIDFNPDPGEWQRKARKWVLHA